MQYWILLGRKTAVVQLNYVSNRDVWCQIKSNTLIQFIGFSTKHLGLFYILRKGDQRGFSLRLLLIVLIPACVYASKVKHLPK